ncbi:MAG TPA: ribbon-helix-helix domain-containing protein [Candidatus Nanoarchaeia archaeon]|nr:ribbon-helix-helix domain-containing protein [Candidatus Nanoarchaeia archaeon]
MTKAGRKLVPVSLPEGLAQEIDLMVEQGEFTSRSDALKFGARLVVMMSRRTHQRAEDYAYQEIKGRILRGK